MQSPRRGASQETSSTGDLARRSRRKERSNHHINTIKKTTEDWSFRHRTMGETNMNNITEEEIDEIITAVHHQRGEEYITDLLLDLRLRIAKD